MSNTASGLNKFGTILSLTSLIRASFSQNETFFLNSPFNILYLVTESKILHIIFHLLHIGILMIFSISALYNLFDNTPLSHSSEKQKNRALEKVIFSKI
ncbi:hypothetical protein Avbf_11797 [Armadillidium vulgare]|nr:hypothetical protein Avbf_11797 [Armadillidium vulgare]